MRMTVLDGDSVPQTICVRSPGSATDRTVVINATNEPIQALPPNADRSGWLMQNVSQSNPMIVNELGADPTQPASLGSGSWLVSPGAFFPPSGYDCIPLNAIMICGTQGDVAIIREW